MRPLAAGGTESRQELVAAMTADRQLVQSVEQAGMAAPVLPADQPRHWRPSGLVLATDAALTMTDPEHGSIVRQLADGLLTANRPWKGIQLVPQTAPLVNQCHRVRSNASRLAAVTARAQHDHPRPERVLDWPSHPATSKRKASSTEEPAGPPSRQPRLLGPKQWDVLPRPEPSLARERLPRSHLSPLVQPGAHRQCSQPTTR